MAALNKHALNEPTVSIFNELVDKLTKCKNGAYPPVSGLSFPGETRIFINSAEFLEDIFVKKN